MVRILTEAKNENPEFFGDGKEDSLNFMCKILRFGFCHMGTLFKNQMDFISGKIQNYSLTVFLPSSPTERGPKVLFKLMR